MAESLAVAAAGFVAEAILFQIDEKLNAITDVKGKMEKLKELSWIIDRVIQDIESRLFIDDAAKDLVKKLKYLAYDLEDVVDYYDTKVLQKKQRSKTFLRPVSDFFSSDNQVLFKSRVGGMINAITESLESILLQKSILFNLPQGRIRMSEPRLYKETSSIVIFDDVIGRELEKNMIVDMLTKDDDDESNQGTVKVIAIVGMGGLGKTTLAQLVFNDERVEVHFGSSIMWTHVGAEFDPAKIMKSVLESASHALVDISEIELVKQQLEKALSGKRFLLVLDDVWNEDALKWNDLKAALTCGARGSKILVTTRSQKVSKIMGASNTTHHIKQLSPADCSLLFQKCAFGSETPDQTLMAMGRKIVEKCGGVPLAAISLGRMLYSIRDETFWLSVLSSEIWQLDDEKIVLDELKLSYDTLPPRSKKCFAFGSLFPKSYLMHKDELIKLWIANGFVCSEGNFDAERVGNHVFDDLVSGSFFLLAPSRDFEDDSHVTVCTMHDLMHDLARSVSADAYWNSYQDSVEDIRNRTYHLFLYSVHVSEITQALGKEPLYLRTLILSSCDLSLNANLLEIVFSKLKFLRVLDLSDNKIKEVPISIGHLIHLRYLNLSGNNIKFLPESITLLHNLQFLDCDCLGLAHMPCGLSRLINLRSLPVFVADNRSGACSIIELEDLKLHGGMTIQFSENFTNYSCGGRKILKNKHLNELSLRFNGSQRYDKDMLDDLFPNTSIKKLRIFNYGSRQFPTWLMESQLPNLVEVCLERCGACKHIPPFGNLRFLKKLDLQFMYDIRQMGAEFHGLRGFPSLQELILNDLFNLEEWSESHVIDQLFPLLQKLWISNCPELKCMPRFPRIQELEISYCSRSLLSCLGRLTSLSVLRVEDMNDMTSLPSGCIRNLTSLQELHIIGCVQLKSLPWDGMQHLERLHSLTIYICPSIIWQSEILVQILNSLHEFKVEICGKNINLRGQLQHLSTLKELFITGAHGIYMNQSYIDHNNATQLGICCCEELESLMTGEPTSSVLQHLEICDISNLTTLPDWLRHLKSLRALSLHNCSELGLLPRGLMNLHMLKILRIIDCPQLKRRCEREIGEDWHIISHVPYLDIP